MKLFAILFSCLALVGTATAQISGQLNAGTCIIDRNNIEVEDCVQFGAVFGYDVTERITAELTLNFLDGDVNGFNGGQSIDGDYDRDEFLIGARYDLDPVWKLDPYVGFGVGYGQIKTEFTGVVNGDPTIALWADDKVGEFLWAAKAGTTHPLTPKLSVFGEVGYTQYLDNGFDAFYRFADGRTGLLQPDGVKGEDRSYDVRIGLRLIR